MMLSKSFKSKLLLAKRVGEFLFSVILNERQNMKNDKDQKHLLLKNLRILNQSKMTKYLPPGQKKKHFLVKKIRFSN
jgi:hypothetical protein